MSPAAGEMVTEVKTHFLQPAEAVLCDQPAILKTVLGSCVGITLRAPRLGYAAMAHCVLPEAGPGKAVPARDAIRYVDTAIARILQAFEQHGANLGELEVKLFGGADGLSGNVSGGGYEVGRRNADSALRELAARGIEPVMTCLGGTSGRVIEFDTATGEVRVRTLDSPAKQAERRKGGRKRG